MLLLSRLLVLLFSSIWIIMAVYSRGRTEGISSPERTKLWVESNRKIEKKVSVVYYLSRNGQFEHPHFVEVTLSSPQGLYLRDVIKKLNFLQGQGMASMYNWSSKRSFKNGYVWQDLSDNDFIYPCNGNEYVLKGSQILEKSISFQSCITAKSLATKSSSEITCSSEDSNSPAIVRIRNHSRGISDVANEYKVYKGAAGMNASMQKNDDKRPRKLDCEKAEDNKDIGTPPPSSSRSETTESLKDCISRPDGFEDVRDQSAGIDCGSRRMKATPILMQLIACGSRRVKDNL